MPSSPRPSGPGARRHLWPALVVLVVVLLLGALPLGRNLLDRRDQVLETNTRAPVSPQSSTLRPKRVTCDDTREDGLLQIPEGTRAIRIFPGYTPGEAPPLEVEVSRGSDRLRGESPADYPPGQPLVIDLDRPAPRTLTKVCIRNTGGRTVTLARAVDAQGNDRAVPLDQGGPDGEARTRNTVRVDAIGRRDALAVTLVWRGIDHASAYKPDGVGPVPIAAGLALVLLLGAAGVVLVLRGPDDEDDVATPATEEGDRAL